MKQTRFVTTGFGFFTMGLAILIAFLLVFFTPDASIRKKKLMKESGQVDHQIAIKNGRLPGYEEENINTDKDVFRYLLNIDIIFDRPTGAGNIMLENTPGNTFPMDLSLSLKDGGKEVYCSAKLAPGQCITSDCLDRALEPGIYPALATVRVYHPDLEEVVKTYLERVTLTIKNRFF